MSDNRRFQSSEVRVLHTLRAPALHAAIQEQLKQYILGRRLRPGDRLPTEEQISREIGASRAAVREALRALESLGLIEARHGDGRFVREFTFDRLLDLLQYGIYFDRHTYDELLAVRSGLEIAFVAEAVPLLRDDDLAALGDSWEAMIATVRAGRCFLIDDMQFHQRIFARLDNHLLRRLLGVFWGIAVSLEASGQSVTRLESADLVLDAHRSINDALQARDPLAARAAMERHFALARATPTHRKDSR